MAYKFEDLFAQRADSHPDEIELLGFFGKTPNTDAILTAIQSEEFAKYILEKGGVYDGMSDFTELFYKQKGVDASTCIDGIFDYFDEKFELQLHEMFNLTMFVGANYELVVTKAVELIMDQIHPEFKDFKKESEEQEESLEKLAKKLIDSLDSDPLEETQLISELLDIIKNKYTK